MKVSLSGGKELNFMFLVANSAEVQEFVKLNQKTKVMSYIKVNTATITWDICFMCYSPTSPTFLLGEAGAFDDEWRREAGRYVPPNARALEYGRDRRAGGQQLALPAPPSSSPPPGHRHESPRHRQPQTRPRYDWWEGKNKCTSWAHHV